MEIIPAIDLRGGRCVRLFQGRYDEETVYGDDPVAVARRWLKEGARRLHVVDLDGARAGEPRHLAELRAITAAVDIPVQTGGGIRTLEQLAEVFAAGARWAILGTGALEEPAFLQAAATAHPGRIIVSLDVKGEVLAVRGWEAEAEVSLDGALDRLRRVGIDTVIVTDVSRDGTLTGPNTGLVARVARAGFRAFAAGGIGNLADLEALAEHEREGVVGAIVGRALYTGDIELAGALTRLQGGGA